MLCYVYCPCLLDPICPCLFCFLSVRVSRGVNIRLLGMFPPRVRFLQQLLQPGHRSGKALCSRLVLGIETSCDETGAAVLDEDGSVLGESLHPQKDVHLRWVSDPHRAVVHGLF